MELPGTKVVISFLVTKDMLGEIEKYQAVNLHLYRSSFLRQCVAEKIARDKYAIEQMDGEHGEI